MHYLKGLAISLSVLAIILNISPNINKSNLQKSNKYLASKDFQRWSKDFGKLYSSQQQRAFRFNTYYQNYQFVQSHNNRFQQGKQTFQVGLNHFADLGNQQFSALYLSKNIISNTDKCKGEMKVLQEIPFQKDWNFRAVSQVKYQGLCTGAWAFAAVGALQGLAALETSIVYNFSAQQLIDCSTEYGNQGCNGGSLQNSFWYVIDNGITTQAQYPYVGQQQNCSYTEAKKVFQNSVCAKIKANSTRALQSALVQQPVAVMVASGSLAFQLYRRGIFSGKCDGVPNHGMLLVGYGKMYEQKYWKCKNSWGLNWGQEGYMFLNRNNEEAGRGQCGILTQSSVPLV